MAEFLAFAERYGPWLVILVYAAYKAIPIIAEKLIPDWIASRREAVKADLAARVNVYERFIEQNAQMIQFIASATEALHSFARSLDSNTQQLYHVSQAVERGPSCPLRDCHYWGNKKGED